MSKKIILLISIVVLILVNFALYKKTTQYKFVNRDDGNYVYKNPTIQNINTASIKKIFTEFYFFNYQPLDILAYALEYKYFKLDPQKYHATSVMLHTLNSLLVLLFIYQLTKGDSKIALFIALIFSLHPMQVESVAWVSEQKGLLCAFFYLLSFMAYIHYCRRAARRESAIASADVEEPPDQKKSKPFYFLSLFLFLLALLSKPMAVTLPLIMLLFDYYEESITKSKLLEKIPFFLLSVIISILTYLAQHEGMAIGANGLFNILFAFFNLGFYISKLILPLNLSTQYDYPNSFDDSLIGAIVSISVIISLVIYFINFKKIKKEINFGILFFLITPLPVLKFVPIGTSLAADRYMYIPMIGFFFAIVFFTKSLIAATNNSVLKKALIAVMVIYMLNLGILNDAHCKVWRNSLSLWSNTRNKSKNQYNPVASLSIGLSYLEEDDNKSALASFLPVINDKEVREHVLFGAGKAYFFDDQFEEAKKCFTALINEYPDDQYKNNKIAYMYLGDICATMDDFEEGIKFYEKSLKLDPDCPQVHYHYGISLERNGETTQAIIHYQLANKLEDTWKLPKRALKRLAVNFIGTNDDY